LQPQFESRLVVVIERLGDVEQLRTILELELFEQSFEVQGIRFIGPDIFCGNHDIEFDAEPFIGEGE
jgi:hypothetical protein